MIDKTSQKNPIFTFKMQIKTHGTKNLQNWGFSDFHLGIQKTTHILQNRHSQDFLVKKKISQDQ